jgi:hypothetical protein
MGLGVSFYGFFAAAALWLVAYFVWAFNAAVRDRREPRNPGTPEPRNLGTPS